jgi:transcriptional regulator with XRE-family HTH domain
MGSSRRSTEIKAFLRAMRARLSPGAVGLPNLGSRRRTPGLRLEEAASLSGVSLTWYSAFEGGKEIRVSKAMLARVASALRLSPAETDYLFALTSKRAIAAPARDTELPLLQEIVDGFTAGPAFVTDVWWTIKAYNALADRIYALSTARESNLMVRMLLDPQLRLLHVDWDRVARAMVAALHRSFGEEPESDAASALIDYLRDESQEFDAWWSEQLVAELEPKPAILEHPEFGRLALNMSNFVAAQTRAGRSGSIVTLQTAADESTRRRLLDASRPDATPATRSDPARRRLESSTG